MEVSPYKEQLDQMTWSFSRVNAYSTCPRMFKLTYLDHAPKANSAFGEWGSLCHSVYEDFAKGNLAEYECGQSYEERWATYMKDDFPPSRGTPLRDKYYERGKELFTTFEGFPEHWEIISAEQEVNLQIGDYLFVGYIDLLVRDKRDKKLIVVDHKSKSKFKNDEEQAHYALQLYLYAEWVFQHFGEYPKQLLFNMFRVGEEVIIDFNQQDHQNALEWFTSTIRQIYQDVEFWDKIELEYEANHKPMSAYHNSDYFCRYICSCRYSCVRSGQINS